MSCTSPTEKRGKRALRQGIILLEDFLYKDAPACYSFHPQFAPVWYFFHLQFAQEALSSLVKFIPVKSVQSEYQMGKEKDQIPCPLPTPSLSLNHVSFICKSVTVSKNFYENVLGFQVVKRPSSFDFEGAWLFNYGVGIHLLQCTSSVDLPKKTEINPTDNHISFQSPDILLVEKKLQEMDIKYEKRVVEEEGLCVDQLFFHDPDGNMVEICNCENIPVIPVTSVPSSVKSTFLRFGFPQPKPKIDPDDSCSEIALVPMNVAPAQKDFPTPKKEIETTGQERPCPSEPHDDNKPYFLDIMDFYL